MMTDSNVQTRKLTLLTWNIRGLHNPQKISKTLAYLDRHNVDIACLQETHLPHNTDNKEGFRWAGFRISSSYSAYARGVLIIIKRNVPFTPTSTLTDDQGRYAIVQGNLGGTNITIITTYGPNTDDPEFYAQIWAKLHKLPPAPIVWGGDFNTCLDPQRDRSTGTDRYGKQAAQVLKAGMEDWAMLDIWRKRHPGVKSGTCISSTHNTWSRIDYWLTTKEISTWTTGVEHLPRTLSDHAPVKLTLSITTHTPRQFTWRLQPSALLDPVYHRELQQAIEEFFQLNAGTVQSSCTLWEAFKVTIRGHCISKHVGIRGDLQQQLQLVEREIKRLESEYTVTQDKTLLAEIRNQTNKFNELAEDELKYISRRYRARAYGEGGRPGRSLSFKLKPSITSKYITQIMNEQGEMVYDTPSIVRTFSTFFSALYTAQTAVSEQEINEYLDDIALAWLSHEHREYLSQPSAEEEFRAAINSLPNNKAPGLDGLPREFYKMYKDILIPHLAAMFEEAYENGVLPSSLREALLIALPKPDKDLRQCDSYRPLSLLNIDVKILAKIIATRIQPFLTFLVRPDQAGFIPTRATSQNIRTIFTMYHSLDQDIPATAALLDAAKAFDSVEWPFMLTVLRRMGFPDPLLKWIRMLYTTPTARIRINGNTSPPIDIHRGTRQGCPLSPLLFALILEPLACKIRQKHREAALQFDLRPIGISLYADDMVIYTREPDKHLNSLIREYIKFEAYAGLKINWSKSVIIPLTTSTTQPNLDYPLKWSTDPVKYLGIWIHRDPALVIRENYGTALTKLATQVERWVTLPLSLADRIAIQKMIVLPRLLYLFCNIPIWLTQTLFKQIRATLQRLTWPENKHG